MRLLFLLILLMPMISFSQTKIRVPSGHNSANIENGNLPVPTSYARNPATPNANTWLSTFTDLAIVENSVGASSNSKVPVNIARSVNKKSVMKSLLSNARAGGKAIAGRTWVGLAFTLVAEKLYDEANQIRFQWSSALGDFVTTDKYGVYMHFRGQDKLVAGISAQQFSIGIQTYSNKVTSACQSYVPIVAELHQAESAQIIEITADGKPLSQATGNPQIKCAIQADNGGFDMVFGTVREIAQRPITQDEFDSIMIPIADPDPTSYVVASQSSQNSLPDSLKDEDNLNRPVGSASVETDVYTHPISKKAQQSKYDITVNADGTWSVKETVTMRPDLDGQTDVAPETKVPDDTNTGTGGETTPETEQTPFCELYPDVLACQKMGDGSEAESIFSDIKIPEITNPAEFKLDNFLPDNGSCPAPKTYSTSHGSIIYSYEKHCEVARTLRPFLIAFASVTALYLIFFRKA